MASVMETMMPTKALPPPSPIRVVPRSMLVKLFAEAINAPPSAEMIEPRIMTGFLPVWSERKPMPRLVTALVRPNTETTRPILVNEVIKRIFVVKNEESPRWIPQTKPARNSTKRRPVTMNKILSCFKSYKLLFRSILPLCL